MNSMQNLVISDAKTPPSIAQITFTCRRPDSKGPDARRLQVVAFETRIAILATILLAALSISLLLAFRYDRPAWWWVVKVSTGVAALCAVILVVVNIILHG